MQLVRGKVAGLSLVLDQITSVVLMMWKQLLCLFGVCCKFA